MIECKDIKKNYGSLQALSVDYLSIDSGKVTVFAGPNGSGKSTLMKIILGLVRSDSGSIDFGENSPVIGFYPESVSLPENITAKRLANIIESVSIKNTAPSTLTKLEELMSMDSYMNKRIHKLSKGMHKKVGLLLAFAGNPSFVVLDEPFEGVDTIDRDKLMMFIRSKAREETAVVLSTHILDNIEQIADTVFFLKKGKIVCCYDTASTALKGNYHSETFDQFTEDTITELLSSGGKKTGIVNEIYRIIFRETA
jgi:ABC-type multidrug transport system ATPase subunit